MTGSGFRTGLLLIAAAIPAFGCSVYDTRYVFDPRPVDVESVRPGAGGSQPVHTLVTLFGVRRTDTKSGLPASVEVGLRVENTSGSAVVFDPATLVLVSADLQRFPDPLTDPVGPVDVPPGRNALMRAYFPFPEGSTPQDLDLSGLNVRWTIAIDGEPVTNSVSFARRPDGYYYRYYNRVGVGYRQYDY